MNEKDNLSLPKDDVRDDGAFDVQPRRIFQAAELMRGEAEVGLVHDGALYRLKTTRSGKLILTK